MEIGEGWEPNLGPVPRHASLMTPPNQSFQGLCIFLCIYGLFALIYGKVECGCRGQKKTLHPLELPATWRGCWCSKLERGPPSPTGPSLQAPNQSLLGKTENHGDRRIWLNLSPAEKQEFQGHWLWGPSPFPDGSWNFLGTWPEVLFAMKEHALNKLLVIFGGSWFYLLRL